MQVGVVVVPDFPAIQTFVAAVRGNAGGLDRLLAVQRFRQNAGEVLQLFEMMAGEQIRVTEPTAGERTL